MPARVDDLAHSAELVSKVCWGDEPPVVVGESIEALGRVQCQLDLGLLMAVRSFDCRGEHRAEGHGSVVAWLQHHLRLKKRTAQRIARLSRFVFQHPAIEDGMRQGVLTFDHVEAIADVYKDRYAQAWDAAFPHIIDYAAEARFEDVARHLRAFADGLSPQEAEDRFEEQLASRSFTKAKTLDGYGFLRGWMDPLSYDEFAAEHDRRVNELFEADWSAAKEILGRDPEPLELIELTRSAHQRSHDALVEMARRSKTLAGGAVAAGPEVVFHTTWDTYQAEVHHLATGEPMVIPTGGFCQTDVGTPITPAAAVYASLVGKVRRIVFGAHDEILSYGRARRAFTPTQAAAARAKLGRCAHPYGCDRTGPLLQTDHVTEHQDGGPTDITNAEPRCGPHNRWKTNTRGQPPPTGTWTDTNQRRGPPNWC